MTEEDLFIKCCIIITYENCLDLLLLPRLSNLSELSSTGYRAWWWPFCIFDVFVLFRDRFCDVKAICFAAFTHDILWFFSLLKKIGNWHEAPGFPTSEKNFQHSSHRSGMHRKCIIIHFTPCGSRQHLNFYSRWHIVNQLQWEYYTVCRNACESCPTFQQFTCYIYITYTVYLVFYKN